MEALPQFSCGIRFLVRRLCPKEQIIFLATYLLRSRRTIHSLRHLQLDGDEVPNRAANTRTVPSLNWSRVTASIPRFALQLNLPVIYRWYRRPNGFAIEHGTESGLGDISLLGNFVLFHFKSGGGREVNFDDPKNPRIDIHEPDFTASVILIGGVKFLHRRHQSA